MIRIAMVIIIGAAIMVLAFLSMDTSEPVMEEETAMEALEPQ